MKRLGETVSAALVMSALLVTLGGCEGEKGPAERAGESVDNTIEKAGRQIEKAGEGIQDAARGEKK
jgi:predicted small secreted protein